MSSDSNPEAGFAKPSAEHAWLMSHVGTWKVHCEFYMDPSQPPMVVEATDTCEAHGPFFTVSRFEAEMFGMPFVGLAQMGYDPVREEYVSTWIDNVNPFMYQFAGRMDAAGEVLELRGRAPDPHSRTVTDWRTTERHLDDGSRVFEMFMTIPGGPEVQLFTHRYVRA